MDEADILSLFRACTLTELPYWLRVREEEKSKIMNENFNVDGRIQVSLREMVRLRDKSD